MLPFRPKQSAMAYHKIGSPEGSLEVATICRAQTALQQRLVPVELALRSQIPSIEKSETSGIAGALKS